MPSVGERVRLQPAHVDPMVEGERVVDHWPVDLRHW